MRFAATLTGIAALVLGATAAFPQDRSIVIATEGVYEPFNFTMPDGRLAGFEVDLAQDLCARAKLSCKIIAQNFDSMIPALQARKFDIIMDSLQITAKREEVIDFSNPYLAVPAAIAVAKDGPLASLPGDGAIFDFRLDEAGAIKAVNELKPLLKGKTIGVQASSIHANFIDTYLKGVVDVREYKTVEQEVLDLKAGRIDGVFAQSVVLAKALAKPEFTNLKLSGPRLAGGVFGKGVAVGLRKGDAELKKTLDAAIASMQADGSLKQLAIKWFKADISAKP